MLRLGDLGRVVEAPETRFGEGGVDGERGLVIVVSAQLGANTKVVAAARRAGARTRWSPRMRAQGLTLRPDIFRPSEFIDLALRNITTSLLLGAVLVAVVLLVFLADVGAAAHLAHGDSAVAARRASSCSIGSASASTRSRWAASPSRSARWWTTPSSTWRTSRGGCGENRRSARAADARREVVLEASLEVRSSVVYATFVVALVFVPVLALTGVQGALFRPLGLAYILATSPRCWWRSR